MRPKSGFVCKAALLVVVGLGSADSLRTALATDTLDQETAGDEQLSSKGSDRGQGNACDEGEELCTIYGDRTSILGGRAQTYVQIEQGGKPRALGLKFTGSMLSNLPYDPPFDGNNCFDINGDGELTFHLPMPECAGGYQAILFFPAKTVERANLPFSWFLLNWNPTGHGPPNVYDVPHFDFHFYIMDYIDRNFIRPGPCGIVVNCDDFETAIKPVPARYLPPDYQDFQAVEPRMGNHLVDVTSPEFTPAGFSRTFVYGSYNGQITYLEPMITLAFLESQPDECLPVKQPQAFKVAGYYPTKYCTRYRSGIYTISLEGLKFRQQS
jgi:hypothetical protein